MVPAQHMDSVHTSAVAKHVCAEGCQFVIERDTVTAGQRFRFNLKGFEPVLGTVRWVVANRIGFAFDRPLCRGSQRALIDHCQVVHGLELFLT